MVNLTLALLNQDQHCLCKQCRFRLDDQDLHCLSFSLWIYMNKIFDFPDWLTVRNGCDKLNLFSRIRVKLNTKTQVAWMMRNNKQHSIPPPYTVPSPAHVSTKRISKELAKTILQKDFFTFHGRSKNGKVSKGN